MLNRVGKTTCVSSLVVRAEKSIESGAIAIVVVAVDMNSVILPEGGSLRLSSLLRAGGDYSSFLKLEISARKASQQMEISYPTVLKAFNIIQKAISAHSQGGGYPFEG